MQSEFLDIEYFKILPVGSVPAAASRPQILEAAADFPEFPHVVGTPKFATDEKQTDAGPYFVHQFVFSMPSYVSQEQVDQLRAAAAVVLYTDLRTLVFWYNDVFSNVPLNFILKSNGDVTDVELTRSSIRLL